MFNSRECATQFGLKQNTMIARCLLVVIAFGSHLSFAQTEKLVVTVEELELRYAIVGHFGQFLHESVEIRGAWDKLENKWRLVRVDDGHEMKHVVLSNDDNLHWNKLGDSFKGWVCEELLFDSNEGRSVSSRVVLLSTKQKPSLEFEVIGKDRLSIESIEQGKTVIFGELGRPVATKLEVIGNISWARGSFKDEKWAFNLSPARIDGVDLVEKKVIAGRDLSFTSTMFRELTKRRNLDPNCEMGFVFRGQVFEVGWYSYANSMLNIARRQDKLPKIQGISGMQPGLWLTLKMIEEN